jgi:hypothetical protein
MPLLLAIVALWAAFNLLILAVCRAARLGDRQQRPAAAQPAFEPPRPAPSIHVRARASRPAMVHASGQLDPR